MECGTLLSPGHSILSGRLTSSRGLVGWMEWKLRFRMKCGQGRKRNWSTGVVWLLKIFSSLLPRAKQMKPEISFQSQNAASAVIKMPTLPNQADPHYSFPFPSFPSLTFLPLLRYAHAKLPLILIPLKKTGRLK